MKHHTSATDLLESLRRIADLLDDDASDIDARLDRIADMLAAAVPGASVRLEVDGRSFGGEASDGGPDTSASIRVDGADVGVLRLAAGSDRPGRPEVLAIVQAAASLIGAGLERERARSERAVLEDRLRKSEELADVGRLAAGIAHDFNNLLTSIKGLTSLALKDIAADDPIRRDLEEIERAAERATALTRGLLTASRGPRATLPSPAEEAGASRGSEAILVAEDDDSIRRLVARVLERAGYRVLLAEDGRRALEMARAADGRIDLLLTDVMMPRSGGEQLFRNVHQQWPGVRVLYMSGYTDDPVVRREAEGPDGAYLAKPFAPDVLLAAVRRVLDSQR